MSMLTKKNRQNKKFLCRLLNMAKNAKYSVQSE